MQYTLPAIVTLPFTPNLMRIRTESNGTNRFRCVYPLSPWFAAFPLAPHLNIWSFLADPVVSNHCGGLLTQERSRITLPESLANHHSDTVYCDWEIKLQNGSWIDLYVEEMQTTNTQVRSYYFFSSKQKVASTYCIETAMPALDLPRILSCSEM